MKTYFVPAVHAVHAFSGTTYRISIHEIEAQCREEAETRIYQQFQADVGQAFVNRPCAETYALLMLERYPRGLCQID
jgi:hypothetical protein